jgi:hypothetical protein
LLLVLLVLLVLVLVLVLPALLVLLVLLVLMVLMGTVRPRVMPIHYFTRQQIKSPRSCSRRSSREKCHHV